MSETLLPLSEQPEAVPVDLTPQLVSDPSALPPAVHAYQHSAPWYSDPKGLHKEWHIGYLPALSDVPAGLEALRERIVFPIRDQAGRLLGYVGRDPDYERKRAAWLEGSQDGETPTSVPQKRVYAPEALLHSPAFFGQERLARRGVKGKIRQAGGLLMVERPEDVVRLAQADLVAIGLLWQQAKERFVQEVAAVAERHAEGRVRPMLDLDPAGRKAMLERVAQLSAVAWVRVAWTSKVLDGRFAGKQPAQLSDDDLSALHELLASSAV